MRWTPKHPNSIGCVFMILFSHPVETSDAATIANLIMDAWCCANTHCFPITLMSDNGPIFVSQIMSEVAAVPNLKLPHATSKHVHKVLEHWSEHTPRGKSQKLTLAEFRPEWHECLTIAVLNQKTTYHESLACEPSSDFHGFIPYKILNDESGYNANHR